MAIDPGSVTIANDGTATGSGLALSIYNYAVKANLQSIISRLRGLMRTAAKTGTEDFCTGFASAMAAYRGKITVAPSGGQFDTIAAACASIPYLAIARYDSPTALNSTPYYFSQPLMSGGGPIWLRIRDDSTLLKFYVSSDGSEWAGVFEVSRTDFMSGGPDQIGIFVDAENDATPNLDSQMLVDAISLTAVS